MREAHVSAALNLADEQLRSLNKIALFPSFRPSSSITQRLSAGKKAGERDAHRRPAIWANAVTRSMARSRTEAGVCVCVCVRNSRRRAETTGNESCALKK